jgi:hypothetical protein
LDIKFKLWSLTVGLGCLMEENGVLILGNESKEK